MNWNETAIIIIDLQEGVTFNNVYPNDAQTIIEKCNTLIEETKRKGGFIVYVHSDFIDEYDQLSLDKKIRSLYNFPNNFADFDRRLIKEQGAYTITKRGISAFFATDLDIELRRHKIKNIVLSGISTHMGVDTSARDAYQLGYNIFFLEDCMSAPKLDQHEFMVRELFPLMGQVLTLNQILYIE